LQLKKIKISVATPLATTKQISLANKKNFVATPPATAKKI
jgi:hypothetical protein